MKKTLSFLMLVLMLGNSRIAFGQEASLEERVAELEKKVEMLMNNSDSQDNDNPENTSVSEGNFKVVESIPTNIDEGLEYLPYKPYTATETIKVANVRYNETHIFIDFEFVARSHDYSLVDNLDRNYYFTIKQPYNSEIKENNSSFSEDLVYQLNQYPEEMVGNLPMLEANLEVVQGNTYVTIPYKLSLPKEKGSKVILTFDSNQTLEIELE